jgi:hypothetical protein
MINLIMKYIEEKYIKKVRDLIIDIKWKIKNFKRNLVQSAIDFFKKFL